MLSYVRLISAADTGHMLPIPTIQETTLEIVPCNSTCFRFPLNTLWRRPDFFPVHHVFGLLQ